MSDQSPFCRKSTPLVISSAVAVVFSRMGFRIRCPVLFHCDNPNVISLRRKYASLSPPTGAHDVSTLLSQKNNKLYLFLHEPELRTKLLISRLAVALFD